MNTVTIDNSSTDRPLSDASTEDNDKTRIRATSAPPPDTPSIDASDESPIMRMVRTHERQQPTAQSASHAAKEQTATLPITVLTNDPAFADQVRSALGDEVSVTAIASADEAAALAASRKCPIVITDTTVTRSALEILTRRLRAHDPATAIVVSGNRDHSGMFIGLQSSGAVDAFLLKPITTAATQLVIEAATRRYRSYRAEGPLSARHARQRTHSRTSRALAVAEDLESSITIESKRKPPTAQQASVPPAATAAASKQRLRPSWSLVASVAIFVAGIVAWGMSQRSSGIDAGEVIAKHLTMADAAFAAKRLLGVRDGAAHHYQTVLEIDPQNLAAHRGLDAIARELSKQAQIHMSQQRLADAAVALARLRELQPSYAELPLLDSQLRILQDSFVASHAAARAPLAPLPPAHNAEAPKERTVPHSESRRPSASVASSPKPIEAPPLPQESPAQPNQSEPTLAEPPQDESQAPPIAHSADSLVASLAPPPVRSAITPETTPAVAPEISQPLPDQAQPQALPDTAPQPAKLIKYVSPQYPSEAYARRMEGWIEISMEIAPNGDVIAPRIEDGERRQLFGRSALAAVRQWKYAPDTTRAAGKRSSVRLEFKME